MTTCRICKRPLKNPKYVGMGIGPICARKNGISTIGNAASKSDNEMDVYGPYDGGDIYIERILSGLQRHIKTNVPRVRVYHSPVGFEFGYGGSGPADFALNCCLLLCAKSKDAEWAYQAFKAKFVVDEKTDKLTIPLVDATTFLSGLGIKLKMD